MSGRRFVLGLNIDPIGHHNGAWRHPATRIERIHDIDYLHQLARLADDNGLDLAFIADGLAYRLGDGEKPVLGFEPLTLFGSIAAVTRQVGLVCTVSSTYTEPYNLARAISSLDRLSKGRVAWNVVTTANDAAALNFGRAGLPPHADRYRRAHEYLQVVDALWTGWEADAVIADRTGGRFVDAAKVHPANHHGEFFDVAGPLNLPRSPQGRPLIVQAGASEDGRDFAARHADVVYAVSQRLEDAQEYYRDIKRRAQAQGRRAEDVLVVMSIRVLVEADAAAARAREAELAALVPVEQTLARISQMIGVELGGHDLDAPVPPLPAPESIETFQTQLRMFRNLVASGEVRTLRELAIRLNGGQGVLSVAGDGVEVADQLQAWFEAGAADGYMILPQQTQVDAANFVDLVLPELRQRGLFRPREGAPTLRERLFGAQSR